MTPDTIVYLAIVALATLPAIKFFADFFGRR